MHLVHSSINAFLLSNVSDAYIMTIKIENGKNLIVVVSSYFGRNVS